MQKKILIAVDGSIHARNGLLYAADLFAHDGNIHFGLIHVQSIVSQYFLEESETDPILSEALKRVSYYNRIQSEDILEKNRHLLMSRGIPGASIEIVSRTRLLGVTKDIIEYAHAHLYHAIVTGRRGLSRMQKIFMGSISAKLAQHSGDVPVWIVDGEIHPEKFLVLVDVAGPWHRLLDHLRMVCAGIEDIYIKFFYIRRGHGLEAMQIPALNEVNAKIAGKEQALIDRFRGEAWHVLKGAGLKESQFEMASPVQSDRVVKMIFGEIEAKAYDTVVIGRHGSDSSFFSGSVSRYVIERLTDHAIWITG